MFARYVAKSQAFVVGRYTSCQIRWSAYVVMLLFNSARVSAMTTLTISSKSSPSAAPPDSADIVERTFPPTTKFSNSQPEKFAEQSSLTLGRLVIECDRHRETE